MLEAIKDLRHETSKQRIRTIIAIISGVLMYFIPPPFDAVITACLGVFGLADVGLAVNKHVKEGRQKIRG